jgi:hypothetical protein
LIVIPTIGTRLNFLERCLSSIREQGMPVDIVIVAPIRHEIQLLADRFEASLIPDPGSLAGAINLGVDSAKAHHEFVNWLGDDDLLEPGTMPVLVNALDSDTSAVVAYGSCRYIDENDVELWISKAGPWANRILKWGPDLIPQPGMLVRRSAWNQVGGVDETFRFAFDLDLLLKLQRIGSLIDIGIVVSSFRWHGDSLTVGDRTASLDESQEAKRRALGPIARRLAWLWEKPVRGATRIAAAEMVRRAHRVEARARSVEAK